MYVSIADHNNSKLYNMSGKKNLKNFSQVKNETDDCLTRYLKISSKANMA